MRGASGVGRMLARLGEDNPVVGWIVLILVAAFLLFMITSCVVMFARWIWAVLRGPSSEEEDVRAERQEAIEQPEEEDPVDRLIDRMGCIFGAVVAVVLIGGFVFFFVVNNNLLE